MRAGELRQRIRIEQFSGETQDSTGDTTPARLLDSNWKPWATRRAKVTDLQGREWFQARQEVAEVTHRIELRYLEGVTANMRVIWREKKLEIKSAGDPDGRKRKTVIMAQELIL